MQVMAAASPTSLRAYARHRGVSVEAVSKAIMSGRLKESVVVIGGKPKVASVEIADREWDANTRPRVDRPVTAAAPAEEPVISPAGVPDYNRSRALREAAAARREAALADMAEIEVAEKRGELVPAVEARAYIIDKFTVVKTKILGVPTRIAQQLPELAAAVVPVVDSLLREALEELAAEQGDAEGEAEEDE